MQLKKISKVFVLAISSIAFTAFTLLWWWRSKMPYNEAGRYYDGLVVWHEQEVTAYAWLSIFSFIILAATSYLTWRRSSD